MDAEHRYRYNTGYREQLRLRSGHRVRLRLVLPADRARLLAGFDGLSTSSRVRRFLFGKASLSDAELSYFTEIDQIDHFAIGAVELDGAGNEGEGLGIGRFIRVPTDPECAEVAITVIDRMQRHGIGRMLLQRLIGAAVERGIKRFRFECLPHNHDMQQLVRRVCRVVQYDNDEGLMIAEADLPGSHLGSPQRSVDAYASLYELLRASAAETVELQVDLGMRTLRRALNAALGRSDRDDGVNYADDN